MAFTKPTNHGHNIPSLGSHNIDINIGGADIQLGDTAGTNPPRPFGFFCSAAITIVNQDTDGNISIYNLPSGGIWPIRLNLIKNTGTNNVGTLGTTSTATITLEY